MDSKLTVNSPVSGSKPTWTVCSKFSGDDITGLSDSRIFVILLPVNIQHIVHEYTTHST